MLLRRADVVAGALTLLDAEGLDGLTMRKLGAVLNVQAGALYRHFENKESLLDAMAEQLLEGVGEPVPEGPWQRQVRELAGRLRTALRSRRDGARVVAGTYVPAANTHAAGRVAVEILCAAGVPPEQAGWLTFAVFYYVLGHTIEEQALEQLVEHDDWNSRLAATEADKSPQYNRALQSVVDSDPGERFYYGLDVFIEGVAARLR